MTGICLAIMMTPIAESMPWIADLGKNSLRMPARNRLNAICRSEATTPTARAARYAPQSASEPPLPQPSPWKSLMQPIAITINPAAGPLIVSSLLLMRLVTILPITAVKIPAIGG